MSYNLKENVMKEDRLSGGPFSSFFPKAFPLRGSQDTAQPTAAAEMPSGPNKEIRK